MNYSGIEDGELVRRVHLEPAAFDELVARHSASVLRLCSAVLGDPLLAEDAAQETFLRVWKNLEQYDAQRSFRPWLLRIALNQALNTKHRQNMERQTLAEKAREAQTQTHSRPQSDATRSRLCAALCTLPEQYRTILTLRACDGLSCGEIGEMLSMSPNAVSIAIYKAKKLVVERMRTEHEVR